MECVGVYVTVFRHFYVDDTSLTTCFSSGWAIFPFQNDVYFKGKKLLLWKRDFYLFYFVGGTLIKADVINPET